MVLVRRMMVVAALLAVSVVPGSPSGAVAGAPSAPELRTAKALVLDLTSPERQVNVTTIEARLGTGTSRRTVARDLVATDSGIDLVIRQLYTDLLLRQPDSFGRTFWRDRIRSGRPASEMARTILASAELYSLGGGTDAGWVDLVYRRALGRPADAGGLAYWTERLATGTPRSTLVRDLWGGAEGRGRRIDGAFSRLLLRLPAVGDRAYWVGRMAGRDDVREMPVELAATTEYDRLARTRGDTLSRAETVVDGGRASLAEPELRASGDGSVLAYAHRASAAPSEPGARVVAVDRVAGTKTTVVDLTDVSLEGAVDLSTDGEVVVAAVRGAVLDADGPLAPGEHWGVERVEWRTGGRQVIGPQAPAEGYARDPSVDADGDTIAYVWVGGGHSSRVVVHDATTGTDEVIAEGSRGSDLPAISPDGRWVAFTSESPDIVPGAVDGTARDVFVHDRETGTTTEVSAGRGGVSYDATVSPSGQVAFVTYGLGTQMRPLVVWSPTTGVATPVPDPDFVDWRQPEFATDRYVVGVLSGRVAVWDRRLGRTSTGPASVQTATVSGDGGDVFAVPAEGLSGHIVVRWTLDAEAVARR